MVTGGTTTVVQGAGNAQKKPASEHRRSNKPIMEKRRRARINNCLNELKALILDAMKKDPARHSKLEKADILEMTVKHLETLQRQRTASDPESLDRFRAGYQECVQEVKRYKSIEAAVKTKLVEHLTFCIDPAVKNPESEEKSHGAIFLSTGPNSGVRLVPTRLANGDIALVVPSQMPVRTSSTASASSFSSMSGGCGADAEVDGANRCFSPMSGWSGSPTPEEQSPLSLVIRRSDIEGCDEKPWRPWSN